LIDNFEIDPVVDDNYILKFAAKNGHTKIVKLLLAGSQKKREPTEDKIPVEDNRLSVLKSVVRLLDQRSADTITDLENVLT
jgi:hypothetical protein